MPIHNISEKIYSHATRLIAPFSSESGAAWAAVPTSPLTHEAWPLASAQFRDWLAWSFFAEHQILPGRHALTHAIRVIQARARFDPKQTRYDVFHRIGYRGRPHCPEALILNLANDQHEAVEITTTGWRMTNSEGQRFCRIPAARPLPRPSATPDPAPLTAQLRTLLPPTAGLDSIAAWLFSAMRPTAPYPILILTGPPASGKSTTARLLRTLLDPNAAPLQTPPSSERDLYRHALHNRVLAFDHVPSLQPEIAAALPRVAVGTAFTRNGAHPYDDPEQFSIERPIIITVPYSDTNAANWTRHHTIQNLAITVRLEALAPETMRAESDLAMTFEQAAPNILATLCNAASAALPYAGDLQQWITSAALTLGVSQTQANAALNTSPLVTALLNLLAEEHHWTGTATALLGRLEYDGAANAKTLSEQLAASPLALYGIEYESLRRNTERLIWLSVTHSHSSASLSASSCVTD